MNTDKLYNDLKYYKDQTDLLRAEICAIEEKIAPLQKKITQIEIENVYKVMRQKSTRHKTHQRKTEEDLVASIKERTQRRDQADKARSAEYARQQSKKRYRAKKTLERKYYIPDPTEEAPAKQIEFVKLLETSGVVQEILGHLPVRMQRIIKMRYYDEMTLPEIAKCLSFSYGHIYDLHKSALRRLRHPEILKQLEEVI